MTKLLRNITLSMLAGGSVVLAGCSGSSDNDIDLKQVLDVTVETIVQYEDANQGQEPQDPDAAFLQFGDDLAVNYNKAEPKIYNDVISVSPQQDASLIAFVDKDGDTTFSQGDDALYLIEIDGENSRIIATSRTGAVGDTRISGTGLLAGYLLGSMLSRQRAAGVNPKNLANKKTQTAKQAARSRAGSGSHSRGK